MEETVEIAERYKFFKHQQQPGETVVEYMSGLKQLASTCNFADYLASALRDQFVCRMRGARMQRELFSVKDLTLPLALQKSGHRSSNKGDRELSAVSYWGIGKWSHPCS